MAERIAGITVEINGSTTGLPVSQIPPQRKSHLTAMPQRPKNENMGHLYLLFQYGWPIHYYSQVSCHSVSHSSQYPIFWTFLFISGHAPKR